jgi:predicted enzyme related to lactoylglutathione lyase
MPERSSYAAGTPCLVDVSSEDLDATIAFYSEVFGSTRKPFGETYDLQKVGDRPVGGIGQADDAAGWQVQFAVVDADAIAAKAVELGGEIVSEPADCAYGLDTLLRDPQGVIFHALRMRDE